MRSGHEARGRKIFVEVEKEYDETIDRIYDNWIPIIKLLMKVF